MQRLRRTLVWLSRIHHCRGFGIQSPTDYRFVRYVINEHWPYYRYADLAREVTGISGTQRKLCELCFRLANYCQADWFVDIYPATDAYATYVTAGCSKTNVCRVSQEGVKLRLADPKKPCLVRVACQEDKVSMLSGLLHGCASGTVVMVEGIKKDRAARRQWKAFMALPEVGASYDLYYCGIIIADNRRYKKNYIINF